MELDKLGAALAKAQGQVKNALKDSSNPFFKSKYADLASVTEACKDAFTENGLSVVQMPGMDEHGRATVHAMILHASGQVLDCGVAAAPLAKADAQGVGSVITYLRRYQLQSIAWVAPEDDDGNAASEQPKKKVARPLGVTKDGEIKPVTLEGKPLKEHTSERLAKAADWFKDKPDKQRLFDAINVELDNRRENAVDSVTV